MKKTITTLKRSPRRLKGSGTVWVFLGMVSLMPCAPPVQAQSVDLMELQRQNDAQRNAITPPEWKNELERKNMALESQRLALESQRVGVQAQKQAIQNNAKIADGMATGLRRGNTKLRLNSVQVSGY